ncbi:hypothetical protein BsWGS_22923 [Bradybaena similaris]
MLAILLLSAVFHLGDAVNVDLKVTSDSEDDTATAFTFKCKVSEYDNMLVFISLFRERGNGRSRELIAIIDGLEYNKPFLPADFERYQLEGHIDSEPDSESFLELVIPDFGVEDLGLYICEVTEVDENGEITLTTAEARVAARTGILGEEIALAPVVTSIPLDETTVPVEETTVAVEETTVPVEETTAPLEEITVSVVETTVPVEEATVPVEETTVPVEEITVQVEETTAPVEETGVLVEGTTVTEEETTVPVEYTTSSPVDETAVLSQETTVPVDETTVSWAETTVTPEETTDQAAALEEAVTQLSQMFEKVNASLVALEKKLADLDEPEKEDEETNETTSELDGGEVISNFFVHENSSYLFFKSHKAANVSRAQAACESRRLYLTEVNDAGELQAIAEEISPYIVPEAVVMVAGEQQTDQDVWLYQGSQQQVDFFAWDPNDPLQPKDSGCLALRKSESGLTMVSVPCTSDQGNFYFLCEHDE